MRRTWKNIAAVVCLGIGVSGAVAADRDAPAEQLFLEKEVNLDIFGSVSVGQEVVENLTDERVKDNGRLGAGLGLSYFFNRNIGIGADAYTENWNHSFVDNTSGNLIVRFPIDKIHLAPYIYGGGGYQFDPTGLWFAQAGAGVELRFTRQIGIFADARYVMTDEVRDIGVGRAGLRLAF